MGSAYVDRGTTIRDASQTNQMSKPRADGRIRDNAPMTGPFTIYGSMVRPRGPSNVSFGYSGGQGADPSDHSLTPDNSDQGSPVPNFVLSNMV